MSDCNCWHVWLEPYICRTYCMVVHRRIQQRTLAIKNMQELVARGGEVSFIIMTELTQRTQYSCKPPAGASCQQNCLSSEDLRRKKSQRKKQMRNRMMCTQQRGTFFKRTCEASSAAHPHSTGSLLPWQETCWLHYYCCPVIQLWSRNMFDEWRFFFQNQALFSKLVDQSKCGIHVS